MCILQWLAFLGLLCIVLSCLFFFCSGTLDNTIAALEQQIRDLEADIKEAESKAEKAEAKENAEDLRFWRTEELQLRERKQQLSDEKARKEVLQQGVADSAHLLKTVLAVMLHLPYPEQYRVLDLRCQHMLSQSVVAKQR